MNSLSLSYAYLRHTLLSTLLTTAVFVSGVAMIVIVLLVNVQLQNEFTRNLKGIDLVVGGKGSPLQLILSSVFHLDIPSGNIPLDEAEKLGKNPMVRQTIPISLGDNYLGFRIVGTTRAYPEHYGAQLKAGGRYWGKEMEAVLGAAVAAQSGLKPGDSFAGSHGLTSGGELHSELRYTVVGILESTGTVIDRLALTGGESIRHIHAQYSNNEKDEQRDPHHVSDPSNLKGHDREITSLLISYATPFAAVELPRQINTTTSMQAASPAFEIARLNTFMGGGTQVIKYFAWFLIALAGFSIFAGLYNAMNERRYDLALMRSFGARPGKLFSLMMAESLLVSMVSVAVGVVTGHLLVECSAVWLASAKHIQITGRLFLIEEVWLFPVSLLVGALAALLPAVRVYRIDIFKTLVRR